MKPRRLLCAMLALCLLLCGCGQAAPVDPPAGQIGEPHYPEMAPYPNETLFFNENSGEFDGDSFSLVYDDWRESQQNQYNQPEGYADSLSGFFRESIPEFLAASEGNAACSPLNIYMALAMLAEVTGGTSRQQIMTVLNAADLTALRTQADHVWNAHYCADGATSCLLANSLWLEEGLTYDPNPIQALANLYHAATFQGDLGTPELDGMLRDWLNEQTDGLLEDQVNGVSMDPQTILALASTICYRAKWSTEFSEQANTQGVFHAPDGDRQVTFMNTVQTYGPYWWGSDFGAVSLRLEDGSRMWLVLPDAGKTPADVLASGEALELILGSWAETENQKALMVNLSLPKFDIVSDVMLNQSLQSLGITEVFDAGTADFTALIPQGGPCWLDKVQHAARVAIDEEGVTATAYTVMMTCGAARPPEDEIDFILDRPFLFLITSRDNLPLFAGVVENP